MLSGKKFISFSLFQKSLPGNKKPESWINVGGQLIKKNSLDMLLDDIHQNVIGSWSDIHQFYQREAENYPTDKMLHALDMLYQVHGLSVKNSDPASFVALLQQSIKTAEWITDGIYSSRKKDYLNPFRKMVYENQAEMDQVVGKLEDNGFIENQYRIFQEYKSQILELIQLWKLQ